MKNYKHTFFAYLFVALFIALSLSRVFKSDALNSLIPEPAMTGCFYSMHVPFMPGAMFSDQTQQIVLDQSNHTTKSLDDQKLSATQLEKAAHRHTRFSLLYNKRLIKSICDFNCVIQI